MFLAFLALDRETTSQNMLTLMTHRRVGTTADGGDDGDIPAVAMRCLPALFQQRANDVCESWNVSVQ